MSRRVALLGKPVAESLDRMQNAAFAAAGLDWEYSRSRSNRTSSRRRSGAAGPART